jgi:hypothetical protein
MKQQRSNSSSGNNSMDTHQHAIYVCKFALNSSCGSIASIASAYTLLLNTYTTLLLVLATDSTVIATSSRVVALETQLQTIVGGSAT